MKTVTAKELRSQSLEILKRVKRGEEVVITMRGKSVAVMKPLNKVEKRFRPIGFGMWKARKDMLDVKAWLDKLRKEQKFVP